MVPAFALLLAAAPETGRAGPDLTRYVVTCAILLAALGALAWGLRKMVAGSVRTRAGRRSLQVLDVLPLGGKQRVCVVRCYDRTFALGVGDKEVGLIAEIDAAVSLPAEAPTAQRASFGDVLARLRGRRAPETEAAA